MRLKDERRYCIFADLERAAGRDPPTLLAPFRTRTTHIVHLGLIRSSRPLFKVRQLGDLANGSPGVDDGALNSARGNKDSYIASLTQTANAAPVSRQVPRSAVTGTNSLDPRRAKVCVEAQDGPPRSLFGIRGAA